VCPRSLLVNRFAVLDVEEVNTEIREPINAPPLFPSAPVRTALPWRPKWEKRLPRQLSANILDAPGTSIVLPIEIGTTDTSDVMNIEWDYSYYQPWSDNEWIVDEMLAMLDEDVTMQ